MNSKNNPKKTIISMVMVFFTGVVLAWNFSATAKPELPDLPVSPEVKPSNLESWAHDVLTGVAKERGVSAESVVTPENITFMLAWQKGEGGGTDGHCGRFNPLNTKYLKDGVKGEPACKKKGESFATVNYATYADGVAAVVYTITGKSAPFQTRIADALTKGMSAEDMAHVLAFPDEFGGDQKCWACPGGGGYEKSIKGSIDRLKSSPEAYKEIADKQLDGADEVANKPPEELPPVKPEFDDSSPVTFSQDGQFAFPLKVNREDIEAGLGRVDTRWCFGKSESCHHDYPAADITAPTGTPEVAFATGVIDKIGNKGEGEKNGWIRLRAGDTCYVYAHILPTEIAVNEGQEVKVGELVGRVGRAEDAINAKTHQGTFPHLHFDQRPCGGGQKQDPQPKLVELFGLLPHRGQPAPPAPTTTTTTTTTAPPDNGGKSDGAAPDASAPATAQQMTVPSCAGAPPAQMQPGKVKLKCSTEYEFEYEPTTTEPPEKSVNPDNSCDSHQSSSLSSDEAGDVEDVGQFEQTDCESLSKPKNETTPAAPKSEPSPPDIGDRLDLCGLPKNLPHEIAPGRGGLTIDQQDPAPDAPKCEKPAALASSSRELGDYSSPYDDASDLTIGDWRGDAVETASLAGIDPVLASNPMPEPSGWPWQIFLLLVIPWAMLCVVGTIWLQKRAGCVQLATAATGGANAQTQSLPPIPAQRDLSTRILIWCAKAPFRGAALIAREMSRDIWRGIGFVNEHIRRFASFIWPYVVDSWRQFSRGLLQLMRQAKPYLVSGWQLTKRHSAQFISASHRLIRGASGKRANTDSYDTSTHVGRHRAVPSHRHRLRDAIDYYFRGSDPWI